MSNTTTIYMEFSTINSERFICIQCKYLLITYENILQQRLYYINSASFSHLLLTSMYLEPMALFFYVLQ